MRAMGRHDDRHKAVEFAITLAASTFLMGSSFVAGKILLQDGIPSLLLVGWRFFVAALATLPLVLLEGRLRRALLPPGAGLREAALTILIGLLQTAAVMGLLFLAMDSISASTAAILLFTNPIWVALLGRLFLGEALPASRLAGLAVPASTGSFGLWFVALEKGGATKTSGFLFLAPLFTVLLSFFVLGAPLSWQQAFGGGLIGFALWLVNRNAPARSRREEIAAASAEGRP
jgi:drug/metabolite transporter (DMT)-like permease